MNVIDLEKNTRSAIFDVINMVARILLPRFSYIGKLSTCTELGVRNFDQQVLESSDNHPYLLSQYNIA
jgi:hypothetical protein